MKAILKSYILIFSACMLLVWGCSDDDGTTRVNLSEPTDISADFLIKQDNSGEVSIYPSAKGAHSFIIDFGDGSEPSEEFVSGQGVSHIYPEGTYTIGITARNQAGATATAEKELLLSFLPPENLEVTISREQSEPFKVTVIAVADHAAAFEVYFGEKEDEAPVSFLSGESASYEYGDIGTYTIKVVALSGGSATTAYTEDIEISTPLVLPVTFEVPTVKYDFYYFGGGDGTTVALVDNPDPDQVNSSNTVGAYTKPQGSETWAGISASLNGGIDFSVTKSVAVDVYSPAAGAPVLFKMEKAGDSGTFVEFEQTTTVAGQWETLVFDLSALDEATDYSTLVLFFNFDIPGEGETYYFDNIRLAFPELPLTFEAPISYAWMNFGGAVSDIADNPDVSGINTSSKVTRLVKSAGAETWAGSNILLDKPIDFSSSTILSVKTWSPKSSITVLLKLEDSGSDYATEVSATTTKTESWEELTFDFSGIEHPEHLDVVTIFMNFDQPGEGNTYYIDDIQLKN
ncbi:hypothetical protein SAMN02927921_00061 [Sinomicrobium oceani]|uniref:PKD/Chitinase domain-containing protein n=1 Tax=Sinomicrobium oceani TaxID=1150368 RepID=A0A1K1LLW3_9FLAO|nr:hypothetical protein [Sinomicrobium oceani]SFW11839.1 hypothetical protein SAMN02927921_00061 [Sinomicrobium oceani]